MVKKGFLRAVMSELGFEGSVGVDWAEGYRGNHVSKVWCLGNCNQVGIVEPKCACVHMCVVCMTVHTEKCMAVCAGVRLEMELERHARSWVRKGIALTDG